MTKVEDFDPYKTTPGDSKFQVIYRTKLFPFFYSSELLKLFKALVSRKFISEHLMESFFKKFTDSDRKWTVINNIDRYWINDFYKQIHALKYEYDAVDRNTVKIVKDALGNVKDYYQPNISLCKNAHEEFTISFSVHNENNITIVEKNDYFYIECTNEHWIFNYFDFTKIV